MKKLITLLLALSIACNSSSIRKEETSQTITNQKVLSCDNVPMEQMFSCIDSLLYAGQEVYNDPGKITKVDIIDKDDYCSRISIEIEYGQKLRKDSRTIKKHEFTVCRYTDFFDRAKDNVVFGFGGFGLGFITGFLLGLKK